jgi:uncharacterized protein (DUF305 family)
MTWADVREDGQHRAGPGLEPRAKALAAKIVKDQTAEIAQIQTLLTQV